MKNLITFIFLLSVTTTCIHAQSDVNKINSTLDLDDAQAHLTFIASDELRGREAGTVGADLAALYIKTQLMSYGVKMAPNMDSYYQNVPMAKITPTEYGIITIGKQEFNFPDDFVLMNGTSTISNHEYVFPKVWDEKSISKKNVANKIVISSCGDGTSDNPQSWYYQGEEKAKILKTNGAAGLIELYKSNKLPYKFFKNQFTREQVDLVEQESGDFTHIWIDAGNKKTSTALTGEGGLALDIKAPVTSILNSKNVIGFVQGSDPELRDEIVVYGAHYDHVGVRSPNADQDSIYNGARDNGVGITAILEVAENIAKYPTKRSALFVFFTAEEKGLLGSKYFVNNAPVDLSNIVYNLNIDNGGYNDTTIISVVGLDRTTVGSLIQESCNTFGLEAIEDPAKEQGLFDRSDNVNFAKKGIPAPTFSLGFRSFDAEIFKYYHQVIDEVDSLDFNYLMKYFKAYVLASRKIANNKEKPFWIEGDKYYKAGVELYK